MLKKIEYIETKDIRNMMERIFMVYDEINYLLEDYEYKKDYRQLTKEELAQVGLLEHLRNVANKGLAKAYDKEIGGETA